MPLLLTAVFALLATGCWDRVEINNRGFVVGISIDAVAPADDEEEQAADSQFRICYQIVIPGGQSGDGEGGKGSTGYSNICGQAASVSSFDQYATDKLSRAPFYDHLKVILVSERVASQTAGFADMLDFFMRGTGVRRSIKILVSRGNAADALYAQSPNEGLPAADIEKISGNRSSLEKLPATQIGYIHERFMNETSYAVQALETKDKSAFVSGSAIFDGKTNRQQGALDARQTAGLNFLRGYQMRGTIMVRSAGSRIGLNVYEIRSRIRADVQDPAHIVFKVSVSAVVSIRETTGAIDVMQRPIADRIQRDAASEIESMIEEAVYAVQGIGKDALGLGEELKRNHPRTWKKVKNDWDQGKNLLTACEVRAHARVGIRLTGTVDQTERG
ncbi:Ger(x)C family spore germination protein [Cohnella hashimotonis]|uniref:Ger(X)C family spore germination protein n=1 Tax=Cohnella hashimotonis TaxID=2826895 RepID=A0ABT6TFK8_9BACL|nr:Ger(x)C family spore germination protein [Cohnella hashimotonis]MDI4644739.1 Ger(x)C family spore germination protein [Cohnella hashimotonis]